MYPAAEMPDWIFYQGKSNLPDAAPGIPMLILLELRNKSAVRCVRYKEAMKRLGQIFVMLGAIMSMIAPAPVFCASHQHADHTCCAPQATLSASCCNSDAAPKPAAQESSGNQLTTEVVFLNAPHDAIVVQRAMAPAAHSSNPLHIPPPATILRT